MAESGTTGGDQFHFDPDTYLDMVRSEVPDFDELQANIVRATDGLRVERALELGVGTGETTRRVLAAHPAARVVGIDESAAMLAAAAAGLEGVELRVGRLEDPLPEGLFDLVVSALTVHHLDAAGKADLFARVAERLRPGGRFVLGDVVVPADPADVVTPIDGVYDRPSTVADQLRWLTSAGLTARVHWTSRDLAVLVAEEPDEPPDDDPRRWIGALRASHDRLVALDSELDDDALGRPSMCSQWTVAQVLSHLGSGAEIGHAMLAAAITGHDPLSDGGREEVWARWNAMDPREMATAFTTADRLLVEAYEGLDNRQLADLRTTLPFLADPIDVATLAALRLSEHVLHSWDVAGAFDHDARLAPDGTELLVDLQPRMVALTGSFMPRETRPAAPVTITVRTSEPTRSFVLELGDVAALRPGEPARANAAELEIPAEALVRLISGRLKPGWPWGDVAPSGGITTEELRTAFPGY